MQLSDAQKQDGRIEKSHFFAQIPPKGGDVVQPSGPLQRAAGILVCKSLLTPGAAADAVAASFLFSSSPSVKFAATSKLSTGGSFADLAAQFKLSLEEHPF